jgi:hypothetical protein
MSGHINCMVVARPWDELQSGWMAFRLSDGFSDGVLYDCRHDAIRFQLHEQQCAYWCFRQGMGGVGERDCQLFLDLHRSVYDAGGRMADSDVRRMPSLILSTRGHDVLTRRIAPHD